MFFVILAFAFYYGFWFSWYFSFFMYRCRQSYYRRHITRIRNPAYIYNQEAFPLKHSLFGLGVSCPSSLYYRPPISGSGHYVLPNARSLRPAKPISTIKNGIDDRLLFRLFTSRLSLDQEGKVYHPTRYCPGSYLPGMVGGQDCRQTFPVRIISPPRRMAKFLAKPRYYKNAKGVSYPYFYPFAERQDKLASLYLSRLSSPRVRSGVLRSRKSGKLFRRSHIFINRDVLYPSSILYVLAGHRKVSNFLNHRRGRAFTEIDRQQYYRHVAYLKSRQKAILRYRRYNFGSIFAFGQYFINASFLAQWFEAWWTVKLSKQWMAYQSWNFPDDDLYYLDITRPSNVSFRHYVPVVVHDAPVPFISDDGYSMPHVL